MHDDLEVTLAGLSACLRDGFSHDAVVIMPVHEDKGCVEPKDGSHAPGGGVGQMQAGAVIGHELEWQDGKPRAELPWGRRGGADRRGDKGSSDDREQGSP